MNKVVTVILAVILSVGCFFLDRYIITKDRGSAFYKETENEKNYETNISRIDYLDVQGLTEKEFDRLYGSEYKLVYANFEYSNTIPEGNIIRVEQYVGHYGMDSTDEDGRIYLTAYLSMGMPASDLRNLIDCDEYFVQFGDKPPMYGDEYLVSHNQFYMADGQLCTVEITSAFLDTDDPMENGGKPISGQPPLDRRKPVFTGKKHEYISLELGGGGISPCAYDSGSRSALHYIYNGYFSLLLDDYNGDGDPDYIIRTCDPGSGGSYYYMQCMTPTGRANSQSLPSPHRNADNPFYVYGENAPSIRLNRIDRETVFYLTRNDDSEIYLVILDSELHKVNNIYSVNGKLYSSFYEDGVLSLKCTCLDIPNGYSRQDETASLSLRKLNGRMWEDVTFPEETTFSLRSYTDSEVKLEVPLEKGVYRMEIYPKSGGTTFTEFTVYS